MDRFEFTVSLRVGDLYRYTMRHTYFSLSGVFGIVLSLGSLGLCFVNRRVYSTSTIFVLILVGLLFTVIQPLMLYGKCRVQIRKSEAINAPLSYTVSGEGIQVEQEEQSVLIPWHEVRKAVYARAGCYLYMSPMRALIFPKGQCGPDYEKMTAFIREQLQKSRDYVPEQQSEGEENE